MRSQKLFSDIHPRGNKSGRRIWAFFCAISCDLKNCSLTNIRVEINRAGVFGHFLLDFGAISKIISEIYIRMEINWAGVFGPFLDFGATRNIMPLAASLSSALELQKIEFDK